MDAGRRPAACPVKLGAARCANVQVNFGCRVGVWSLGFRLFGLPLGLAM